MNNLNTTDLEFKLLADKSIHDCIVLERQINDEIIPVVYIVFNTIHPPEYIFTLLKYYKNTPVALVLIKYIPLTDSGEVDTASLHQLAILDEQLFTQWQQYVLSLPEVSQAVAIAQSASIRLDNRTLSELLPLSHQQQDKHPAHQAVAKSTSHATPLNSDQDALSDGGQLVNTHPAINNLQDLLLHTAQHSDKGIQHVHTEAKQYFQPYAELLQRAQCVSAALQQKGLKVGDKVILQLNNSEDFLNAFWGCIWGGFIPVPLSLAPTYAQINSHIQKLYGAYELLEHPFILTQADLLTDIQAVPAVLKEDSIPFKVLEIESLYQHTPDINQHQALSTDLALLLLTSGSTGMPKAVMLTHQNLLSMSAGSIQMNRFTAEDVSLNWMPLDHVGAVVFLGIMAVDLGCTQIHVPTDIILKKPLMWLDLIQQHRASISWAPNFAFSLINERKQAIQQGQWDLSSMRFLVNAGEQIVTKTVRKFLQILQLHALPKQALRPAFGMSETCSGITWSAGLTLENTTDDTVFVELGKAIPGAQLRIVDKNNQIQKEGVQGHLQLKGASVTTAYYNNAAHNQTVFSADGWFNTGDIGYLDQARLVLTGRDKDDIIINGVNIYSHEIEAIVEELSGVQTSFTAAAAVHLAGDNSDKLAIFFVPSLDDNYFVQEVIKRIRKQVVQQAGVNPDYLIPLSASEVPKTAIGKIQRAKLVTAFETGVFDAVLQQFGTLPEQSNSLPNWFYQRCWQPQQILHVDPTIQSGYYLIFEDELGLSTLVTAQLQAADTHIITVTVADHYAQLSPTHYSLNPDKAEHYQALFAQFAKTKTVIDHVLYLCTYSNATKALTAPQSIQTALHQRVYGLLYLLQNLSSYLKQTDSSSRLFVVSNNTQVLDTAAAQDDIDVAKSVLPVLLHSAVQEASNLSCRHIDYVNASDNLPQQAQQIVQELQASSADVEIVYSANKRLVPRLQTAPLLAAADPRMQTEVLKQQAVYVITGGSGGLGLALAHDLIQRYDARILLLSRNTLAPETITQLGENCLHVCVDVCDASALEAAVCMAEKQWQCTIAGIFHLAAHYHTQTLLDEDTQNFNQVLAPKIMGAWAIEQVLQTRPHCLVVYYSALNSFFAGAAVAAYSVASRFMETFATYQRKVLKRQVYCLHWSLWDEVGFNHASSTKQAAQSQGYVALSTHQGLSSLYVALQHRHHSIYIGLQADHPHISPWLYHKNSHLAAQCLTTYFISSAPHETRTTLEQTSLTDRFGITRNCRCLPLTNMPLTALDEIDYARLQKGDVYGSQTQSVPTSAVEQTIATIWQAVLGLTEVNSEDNFFELGGHSLLLTQAQSQLQAAFECELSIVDMFKYSTVASLANFLEQPQDKTHQAVDYGNKQAKIRQDHQHSNTDNAVAVVGIACRFPGADNKDEFWENLKNGVESISFFSDEELLESGVPPELVNHPDYVNASPIMQDADCFDADFFGYNAREAELLDPQQRVLLECAWESLEDAGYNPLEYQGNIGMYAGAAMNTYLFNNILPNRHTFDSQDDLSVATLDSMGGFQLMVNNDKDYVTTRVSYKLNLRGPSINIQTACSTSLVAIHMAAQSVLSGECDMMLAGGVSIQAPQKIGHLYQEGMIVTPDGHCRAFDAEAEGTIFGSGVGLVVLKPLQAAIDNGDHVYAVIKGSSSSNDGGEKVGYAAPSGDGQAVAAAEALAMSGFAADSIDYIEAHGTGTVMGDPIEVNGLGQALRAGTDKKAYCGLGSVKTNIGHMQIASGIAGFIKTVLSIHHKKIPPSLHFNQANPAIDFDSTPFYVNTQLRDWHSTGDTPRRAGINSLGIGGANSHVFIEENTHIAAIANTDERSHHVLTLSARTRPALQQMQARYQRFLHNNPDTSLADMCFTASTGRKHFTQRVAIVAESVTDLQQQLNASIDQQIELQDAQQSSDKQTKIAFLFTGQGAQYSDMGKDLYASQHEFRANINQCADILTAYLDVPLLSILFPEDGDDAKRIHQTAYTQVALFALEYALAKLWLSWGVTPHAVMGHSLGEYVAACIAGVFSLEDALKLVANRARLMQALPQEGAMATVFTDIEQVKSVLADYQDQLSIAASNAPESIVISGQRSAVQQVIAHFAQQDIKTKTLNVSHAFHSALMDEMLADYADVLLQVEFNTPTITLISNLTGKATDDTITTVDYWLQHIRQTVCFAESIAYLQQQQFNCFIEMGPRPALLSMARQSIEDDNLLFLASLRKDQPAWLSLLQSVARLYTAGAHIDWSAFEQPYQRQRCSLPSYAFERKRHWLDAPTQDISLAKTRLHPLLDSKTQSPLLGSTLFETFFHTQQLPFLSDHLIYDQVVASGACHIALIMGAAIDTFNSQGCTLEEIFFPQALLVPSQGCKVQLAVTPSDDKQTAEFKLISFTSQEHSDNWATHATGRMRTGDIRPEQTMSATQFEQLWSRCATQISPSEFYQIQADRHIHLGATYQWMEDIRRGDKEAVCKIRLASAVHDASDYQMPPGLIDSSFGLLVSSIEMSIEDTFVPFSIERISFYQALTHYQLWGHALVRSESDGERLVGDICLYDTETGYLVAEFIGLEGRKASTDIIKQGVAQNYQNWFYSTEWQQSALTASAPVELEGHWLIFADEQGIATALAQQWQQQHKVRCSLIYPDDIKHTTINTVVQQKHQQDALSGLVYLWSQTTTTEAINAEYSYGAALCLIQALLQHDLHIPCYWVTQGTAAFADITVQAQQKTLAGLAKVLRLEHSEIPSTNLDIIANTAQTVQCLLSELSAGIATLEPEVLWHQGQRYVARLKHSHISHNNTAKIYADATYIISGGTGVLGLWLVDWLVAQGANTLVLLSRSGASSERAQQSVQTLQAQGVAVHLVNVDVSHAEPLNSALDRLDIPAVRGIFHAAGSLDDGMLMQQNWQRFEAVWQPKAQGAWNLHQYSLDKPLDYFVLFSSAASVLGNKGQSNYVAANAYLDGLAHERQQSNLPALSINWGPWEQAGMASEMQSDQLNRQGLTAINPEQGIDMMAYLMAANVAQAAVMQCQWEVYAQQLPQTNAFFSHFITDNSSDTAKPQNTVLQTIKAANSEQRQLLLLAFISEIACTVLGLNDSTQLDKDQPLMEQGLDSLQAVEMRNHLGKGIDMTLPVSLLFNYPSANALTEYLMQELNLLTELPATATTTNTAATADMTQTEPTDDAEEDFDFLDELSSEELEALISQELE